MKQSQGTKLELHDSAAVENTEDWCQTETLKNIALLRDLRDIPIILRKQQALRPIYLVRYE